MIFIGHMKKKEKDVTLRKIWVQDVKIVAACLPKQDFSHRKDTCDEFKWKIMKIIKKIFSKGLHPLNKSYNKISKYKIKKFNADHHWSQKRNDSDLFWLFTVKTFLVSFFNKMKKKVKKIASLSIKNIFVESKK